MKTSNGLSQLLPNENIRVVSYCPLCNTQYHQLSARILEEKDGAHLIHIQCRKCNASIVALVLAGAMGISSIGLLTDLSSEDAIRLKHSPTVTSDDVINIYTLLQGAANVISYFKTTG